MSIQSIIDGKFLSLCPASEAVAWLKGKREAIRDLRFGFRGGENQHEEQTLAARNDPYIDFGLARYGWCAEACKPVYERGDHAIKCTFLAHFPNGGFYQFDSNTFNLADQPPSGAEELQALMTNTFLVDDTFTNCFEQKGAFAELTEEEFQGVLYYAGDNPRLSTPYDDGFLDGWSDYSYHNVFKAAWELTATVPNTRGWAMVLHQLLRNCEPPPTSFDPIPVLSRWHLQDDQRDDGIYLRSRLADLLKADDTLLNSTDPALRQSFYRRFNPASYPRWPDFAKMDEEHFLDEALWNQFLWRTTETRSVLRQLCWAHPDPRSNLDKPNFYNGREGRMREEHPEFFADEG
jgi:hypothetical protein